MKPGSTRAINPHLLTGAHALGALPEAERTEFEQHLAKCPVCVDETAGLSETAAALGNAVRHVYPVALRPRVLGAVRSVAQVPPSPEAVAVLSRRQGFRRAAALVAAACAVAAAVAGVNDALTTSTITPVAAAPHTRIGDLLGAADLRLLAAENGSGSVAMSAGRDEMLFLADGLRALPQDRVYELWLVDGRGPRPAGTVRPMDEVTSLFVSGIADADEAILTVEPAAGSPSPTGGPVVTVVLR
ncbi:anti-sigma factor domain-containing protein [Lentzea sp. NPDC059081]|uniref:anti-sigma factor n=1 Tax=Lentzea sp. NPDC059081 TaxID=3346719 RepID=UPI0036ADEEA8